MWTLLSSDGSPAVADSDRMPGGLPVLPVQAYSVHFLFIFGKQPPRLSGFSHGFDNGLINDL